MKAAWLALAALMGSGAAQAAATEPCLTTAEVETLGVALLPDLLEGVASSCAAALPPGATLRAGLPPLLARYRAAAFSATDGAARALGKAMQKELKGAPPAAALPLVRAVIAAELTKSLKPVDCPKYDRAIGLLAPLPPGNIAGLFVMAMELGTNDRKAPFPICTSAAQ